MNSSKLKREGLEGFKPKFTVNGDKIAFGFAIEVEGETKLAQIAVPQDIQDVFHYTDHLIEAELRLGASINDIMTSEDSIISHLMKGF